jgi:hypothetical protein
MPDIVIPNTLNFARARFRLIENVGVSRALYTGRTRTSELGGDRAGCSLEAAPSMAAQRAALKAFAMQAGKRNRVFLYDPGYRPRGSFPATELLTNADFAQGTTGWNTNGSLTASNGAIRARRTAGGGSALEIFQSVGLPVQYAPFAIRAITDSGQWLPTNLIGPAIGDSIRQTNDYQTVRGLRTASVVALSTAATTQFPVVAFNNGVSAGAVIDLRFASIARCALADAGTNLLLRSDELDNTGSWTRNASTVGANGVVAPDGNATGDQITEDTTTNFHSVAQSVTVASTAADFSFSVAFRASGRGISWVQMSDGATTSAQAWFNLSTGALGTTGVSGAGFTNARATITSLGDSWYLCTLSARKTGTFTTMFVTMGPSTADGITSYLGASLGVFAWRATLAQSAAPARLVFTSTTTSTGTAQTGYGIHIKGLPANTAGLLFAGDWVQIITSQGSELKMLTADLDSDAAGLGFLQFAPALRGSVADNAPIIVHRPMGRFISTADAIEYQDEPGIVTTSSFDFEEG